MEYQSRKWMELTEINKSTNNAEPSYMVGDTGFEPVTSAM